jgi:hypothetical protein
VLFFTALPADTVTCGASTYRVTVIGPTGSERSADHCSVGALATWLHLEPGATIQLSSPSPDLGSLYVVRIDDVTTSDARQLLQVRLYPEASGGPIVQLAEPGFIETEAFTGSVSPGWRVLDPTLDVPPSLSVLGVPRSNVPAAPIRDQGGAARRDGPDAISLLFLVAITGVGGVVLIRRQRVRRTSP